MKSPSNVIRETLLHKCADIRESMIIVLNDMKDKMKRKDWHGVSDAANDMRDLDAELVGLGFALKQITG